MRMVGTFCPEGPGGRDCTCCGQPPGHQRTRMRRRWKRRERQSWQREIRTGDV